MSDPTPSPKIRVNISAKVVFWTLSILAVVFALAGFAAEIFVSHDESDLAWPFARQFMFSEEGNFINWYQSVTLLGCGLLAGIVGLARKAAGGSYAAHWFVMAAAMAFVGMDEAAQIHELTVSAFINTVAAAPGAAQARAGAQPEDSTHGAKWMFVYLPIGLILAGAYARFFLALPGRTKWGMAIAATMYVGGAIGMEMLYEKVAAHNDETPLAFALDAASELCEMLGVAVFAGTLVALLARERESLGVTFGGAE